MSLTLLLVDDDAADAAALTDALTAAGHRVTVAADGGAAFAALDADRFDAMILDRMLPDIDGVALLRRLRAANMTVPVVMLSALGRSIEKVEGLDAGADDYVVKPVPVAELEARLRAILRGRGWGRPGDDTLRAGDILVRPASFRAWRNGHAIDLVNLELKLLAELARNAGTVVSRATLVERVWGSTVAPATNVVDVHIRRLRMKLTAEGGDDPITTVRGVGYRLRG